MPNYKWLRLPSEVAAFLQRLSMKTRNLLARQSETIDISTVISFGKGSKRTSRCSIYKIIFNTLRFAALVYVVWGASGKNVKNWSSLIVLIPKMFSWALTKSYFIRISSNHDRTLIRSRSLVFNSSLTKFTNFYLASFSSITAVHADGFCFIIKRWFWFIKWIDISLLPSWFKQIVKAEKSLQMLSH